MTLEQIIAAKNTPKSKKAFAFPSANEEQTEKVAADKTFISDYIKAEGDK
jgi:hypothetical protein